MADCVDFVSLTGLPASAAFYLSVKDFIVDPRSGEMSVSIPRTETLLPLGAQAQAFAAGLLAEAKQRQASGEDMTGRIFPVSREEPTILKELWGLLCLPLLDEMGNSLAALKPYGRSGVSYLDMVEGDAPHLLSQMLRQGGRWERGEGEHRRFLV